SPPGDATCRLALLRAPRAPRRAVCAPALHDALPIFGRALRAEGPARGAPEARRGPRDRRRPDGRRVLRALTSNNRGATGPGGCRSEEHTSELQSRFDLVCRLLLEEKEVELLWRCLET